MGSRDRVILHDVLQARSVSCARNCERTRGVLSAADRHTHRLGSCRPVLHLIVTRTWRGHVIDVHVRARAWRFGQPIHIERRSANAGFKQLDSRGSFTGSCRGRFGGAPGGLPVAASDLHEKLERWVEGATSVREDGIAELDSRARGLVRHENI